MRANIKQIVANITLLSFYTLIFHLANKAMPYSTKQDFLIITVYNAAMYHSIVIVGRLGRDPEMRYMPSGDPVTTISVATDRAWNDKSGQLQRETTWFRVSIFGKSAESANQYLSKGKIVLVEGRLVTDPETGGPRLYQRHDGTTGASFELVANTVRFLSPRNTSENEQATQAETQNIMNSAPEFDF